jgi:hypothetical protein
MNRNDRPALNGNMLFVVIPMLMLFFACIGSCYDSAESAEPKLIPKIQPVEASEPWFGDCLSDSAQADPAAVAAAMADHFPLVVGMADAKQILGSYPEDVVLWCYGRGQIPCATNQEPTPGEGCGAVTADLVVCAPRTMNDSAEREQARLSFELPGEREEDEYLLQRRRALGGLPMLIMLGEGR